MVTALGRTYAGLMSNDDDWARAVEACGRDTGELLWRLPLHDEYAQMVKGRYAQLTNLTQRREASSITAAELLHHFAGDVPGRTSTSPAPPGTCGVRTSVATRPGSVCG